MKRRDAVLAVAAGALVLLGLLAVFAIELANTQAKSKEDVKTRVHERAVLAAALIDSLFQSVGQQIPQYERTYGTAVVSNATLDRQAQGSSFVLLLDAGGRVLAHSRTFTAQDRALLASSTALAEVRAGHPYWLGNAFGQGAGRTIDYAVRFPTRFGPRVLLTGFTPSTLNTFITGELVKIPGVKGAHNYLVDGNDVVLASTNRAIPVGYRFSQANLSRSSGDLQGHYFDTVQLGNSAWRVALVAPDGPLFASVSGLRKWIPWIIFVAFALMAAAALFMTRRALVAATHAREANDQLGVVNHELALTNETLEMRAAELARSNADLEQFASIASHDLQEPLRKVRTFTQQVAIDERDALSEKGRDYLQRANGAAERMQKLIEDLLRFSRVGTHGRPFAPVDMTELTHQVVDDLHAPVQQSGASVRVGRLPTVSGDEPQLRQLMQNLISNALKFHREGVTPEVEIEGWLSDGVATIVVRDNGIGFEPQYSRRIFRVFERLHGRNDYPGTGIGLALCRKIAERHGGTIVADGAPGSGATFTVTLPTDMQEPALAPVVRADLGGFDRREQESHVAA